MRIARADGCRLRRVLAARLERDKVLPATALMALLLAEVFFEPADFEAPDDFVDELLCGLAVPD